MIILYFSMQEEDTMEHTNDKCHVYTFSMQEEDTFEYIDAQHHLCTLLSTCRPLCDIAIHLITHLNILMSRY